MQISGNIIVWIWIKVSNMIFEITLFPSYLSYPETLIYIVWGYVTDSSSDNIVKVQGRTWDPSGLQGKNAF